MSHPDVLIVGGGVIGLTTAYYLARDGASVTVIDKATPGRAASWAGAGIIPPGNPDRAVHDYDVLRATSSRMYPALSTALFDETGINNGYHICGGIEVEEPEEPDPSAAWRNEGISVETFRSEQEPALRPSKGYFLAEMAQVRNPWHLRALEAACVQRGVELVPDCPASGFEFDRGMQRLETVHTPAGGRLHAGQYLIAAGAWTGYLNNWFSAGIRIAPLRGQMVLFRPERPVLRRIICLGRRYLVPRQDGRVLVGSTEEPEAGFEVKTTDEAIRRLTAFARWMVPTLAEVAVEQSWAGLRPESEDGLPYIGQVEAHPNVFFAAGHHRAGIQLSPATGRAMADLLLGRKPFVSLEAFRLDRPQAATFRPAFRS